MNFFTIDQKFNSLRVNDTLKIEVCQIEIELLKFFHISHNG